MSEKIGDPDPDRPTRAMEAIAGLFELAEETAGGVQPAELILQVDKQMREDLRENGTERSSKGKD